MKPTKDLYQQVTDTIISLLESHLTTWEKPWVFADCEGNSAYNVISGKHYQGVNQLLLSLQAVHMGYAKNAWLTFNQASSAGGHIRKGEKSTPIYLWKVLYYDKNGKRLNDDFCKNLSAKELAERGITTKPYLKQYLVFNVFQTEGLPESFYAVQAMPQMTEFEKDNAAEELIASTNAQIEYVMGNRACYNRVSDIITLPIRNQFTGTEPFYATAFHELAHWTGHHTRLNRSMGKGFRSPEYAFEELVAELSSAFLCAELGFTRCITSNAAYIHCWLKALQNDTSLIFKASKLAEEASNYIQMTVKCEATG